MTGPPACSPDNRLPLGQQVRIVARSAINRGGKARHHIRASKVNRVILRKPSARTGYRTSPPGLIQTLRALLFSRLDSRDGYRQVKGGACRLQPQRCRHHR